MEKLSKLQHYGIPTRLVDLTIDPLVALYFAIENTDSPSNGNVRVYIQQGYDFSHTHTRILSLLATEKDLTCNTLATLFKKEFGYCITDEEILKYINEPVFVKHCEELKNSNERLYKQQGAFFICSNVVTNGVISTELKSLDTIEPIIIIRIPYEYKKQIKTELDEKYNINKTTIYPELLSVSDYLREKYRKQNISVDGKYSVVEKQDVSHGLARRVTMNIVLNEQLPIDHIKVAVRNVIVSHQKDFDVIWVNVAKTGDDFIVKNWLIRGQWISLALDERFKPLRLKQDDGRGFYWDEGTSYSTLSDYYHTYAFDEDINLFVYHKKAYEEFKPIYIELKYSYENVSFTEFMETIKKYEENVSRQFLLFQDFGYSKDKNFNDFLYNFTKITCAIDDLGNWRKNKNLNEKSLKYFVESSLKDAEKYYNIIERELPVWKNSIGVTNDDYDKINPYERKKPEYNYTPTIPVSKNAIDVDFNIIVPIQPNNTVKIGGFTNLFDNAQLMLSIHGKDSYFAQSKTAVFDGKYHFDIFTKKGIGLDNGKYCCSITLSIPSTQSKDFVKRAGIEYENLTGQCVKRNGIGPRIEYRFEFEIL